MTPMPVVGTEIEIAPDVVPVAASMEPVPLLEPEAPGLLVDLLVAVGVVLDYSWKNQMRNYE